MATYGKMVDFLIAGLIDGNGNPLSGGKVHTYSAGTTTNKATYTDRAKGTPAANPVVLDSYGKALIFADGVYKFVVKDSADVTLFTLDNLEFYSDEDRQTYPAFSVHKNETDQTDIVSSTWTKVTWSTELFDTNNNFASNKFTPSVAGKYLLTANVVMKASVDQKYFVSAIYKNGIMLHEGSWGNSSGTGAVGSLVSSVVDANGTTDYFEIYFYHSCGVDKDISGITAETHFTGCRTS